MSNYFLLFFEFFKVGLFTFGGGYASLPFLYHMIDCYNWFSHAQLIQLIAISGLTPGPVGLNMATFSGFNTLGIFGSLISSFALVLPMIIITSLVFKLYKRFSEDKYVKTILYVLRPTSCALLCYVGAKLVFDLILVLNDYKGAILLSLLFIMTLRFSRNPVIYIMTSAFFGIFVWIFKFNL